MSKYPGHATRSPRPEDTPGKPIVPWWKHQNLLMSSSQLREAGLYPRDSQLRLWIRGYLR